MKKITSITELSETVFIYLFIYLFYYMNIQNLSSSRLYNRFVQPAVQSLCTRV